MYRGKFQEQKRPKKHRLSRGLRILIWTLAVVLMLGGTAFAYVNITLNKINRGAAGGDTTLSFWDAVGDPSLLTEYANSEEEIAAIQSQFDPDSGLLQTEGCENILLVGSDTRGDDIGRSDTMVLATINYDTGKIHLTSFARTTYVCIPMEDGNVWHALNASYAWGGIDLLVDTIELNFKVDIDNYAIIDFEAFETAIDTLGGIDLELTQAEADYINDESGASLTAGANHLTGEQALWYARCRKIDNDFVRTSRQRIVIEELIRTAFEAPVGDLYRLTNRILPLVTTDLTNQQILSHALQFASMGEFQVDQLMIPIENMDGQSFTGIMYVDGVELYGYDVNDNLTALEEFLAS